MANSITLGDKRRWGLVWGPVVLASLAWAAPSYADSWTHGRDRPILGELVTIDATGESPWFWGFEDVAGDGNTFSPPERAIDVRTVYATTDVQRFWVRAYVSHAEAVGDRFHLFVFVDNDRNHVTGGGANATIIHPAFTHDPTEGGYERVIGVSAEAKELKVWRWNVNTLEFEEAPVPDPEADFELEKGRDSIRVNERDHGYAQASVDLGLLGLTQACSARLFVRSANDDPALGPGDLSTPHAFPCVSDDPDKDGVPDIAVPSEGCTRDDQCPGDGVCIHARCVIPAECVVREDCYPGHLCTPDGRCVPEATGSCTTNEQCGDLVCSGGQCVACTPNTNECGVGLQCAPNGRCLSVGANPPAAGGVGDDGGIVIGLDENVEGGACNCSTPRGLNGSPGWLAYALLTLGLCIRRRTR